MSEEDPILDKIALENALAKLRPADAAMVILLYKLRPPEDWPGSWPPKITEIGMYIGLKFEGKPLSEAAMRYRHKILKQYWAKNRGGLHDE